MDTVFKELPITFVGRGSVNGRKFTKMANTDTYSIYKIEFMGSKKFDVFNRRFKPEYNHETKETDNSVMVETYPSDEEYGTRAFQFSKIEDAYIKMGDMMQNEKLKNNENE